MAWKSGAVAVQYRNKSYDAAKDFGELEAMAQLARDTGKVLIVNDDAQLAFQVGAQGVHLGKEDGDPEAARALLGPEAIIGATVHDFEELEAVRNAPIDYVGIGPVFGTTSKDTGLPKLGLDGLAALCAASPFPVIAIGSIGVENMQAVRKAGAYGAAVISAFCKAENPEKAGLALLEALVAEG